MRALKWLIPLLLGGIALGPALRLPSRLRAIAPQRPVPVLQVQPDTFVVGISAEHRLLGRGDTSVTLPPGPARTLAFICQDGMQVKIGDVIARLDAKNLVQALDDARQAYVAAQAKIAQQARQSSSEIEAARNAVDQAKRELEILRKSNATELYGAEKELEHARLLRESAQIEYDRQKRLSAPGVELASVQQVEQAERALRAAIFSVTSAEKALELMHKKHDSQTRQKESDIADAEYRLKTAEAAVKPASQSARYSIQSAKERFERAQRDLDQATVRAPAAGTVVLGLYYYEQGGPRPLKVGDQVGWRQSIATISNLSDMEVNLPVPESAIAPVKCGQEVLLSFEAVPGRTYHGRVQSVSAGGHEVDLWAEPDLQPGVRYFTVGVAVTDPDARLRPALKCKGQIVLRRLRNVLAVPLSAVVRSGGADYVFVRNGARFVRRRVEIGDRNENAVVVTEGLKPGDIVALRDPTAGAEE